VLSSGAETVREWRRRPRDLPVPAQPATGGGELDLAVLDPEVPVLSAIVIAHDDEATIERSVRSVVEQTCPVPFEVVVAVSGSDRTADVVRSRFPEVTVIDLGKRALPGAARNAGLAVASGDYVSFPGSHIELPQGSLAARIEAHENGWPMVTGSVLNGTTTRSGWASYFLDNSSSLPGRPSGQLDGAPARCSYFRDILLEVGGFPEDLRAGEDTVVNQALWRRGYRAYRDQGVTLVHRTPCTNPATLLSHHFQRGIALGRILAHRSGRQGERRTPRLPVRFLASRARHRLADTDLRVAQWGGGLGERYDRVRPLVKLGVGAAWAGSLLGWLRRRPTGAGY
jgi:glycosyltransferase involved in cell wall biosynthesis